MQEVLIECTRHLKIIYRPNNLQNQPKRLNKQNWTVQLYRSTTKAKDPLISQKTLAQLQLRILRRPILSKAVAMKLSNFYADKVFSNPLLFTVTKKNQRFTFCCIESCFYCYVILYTLIAHFCFFMIIFEIFGKDSIKQQLFDKNCHR